MREIMVKRLLEPCQPQFTSYCPSRDLIATATRKQNVDVWRLNGQRVFGLQREDDDARTIIGIAWKPDGRLLAVSHEDGSVFMIDSFNGKVAHQLQTRSSRTLLPDWSASNSSPGNISHQGLDSSAIAWNVSLVGSALSNHQHLDPGRQLDVKLGHGSDADIAAFLDTQPNLPLELARIDIESSLLKLSTLPAAGAHDDIFSTRASIDSIFHSPKDTSGHPNVEGSKVDVLLANAEDGQLYVHIFDTFDIGEISLANVLPKGLKARRVVRYATHDLSSTYNLIVEAEADGEIRRPKKQTGDDCSLHLITADLRFVSQASHNLPLLAQKATQFHNLLRYISQIEHQLSAEIRTAFDLPSRFVGNVDEALGEKDSSASFVSAACHLIVTGECDSVLKEWLVDQVGERGLKRWEKAVGDCLDLIRRLTSECLLPSLERCQVVVSRLGGLSQFPETATKLGIDKKAIRSVQDTLDMTTILCEDMLRDVCTEVREFAAFMRWLKWEAEVEALEETSERAEEMRESFGLESELRMVIDYIENAMRQSRLLRYIDPSSKGPPNESRSADDKSIDYSQYKSLRNETKKKANLPKLGDILRLLKTQSTEVFSGIASTLRKNVLSSYVGAVGGDNVLRRLDARLVRPKGQNERQELHIIAVQGNQPGTVRAEWYGQGSGTLSHVALEPPGASKIWDVRFVDDEGFLVLATINENRCLLWHPRLGGQEVEGGQRSWQIRHTFADGEMGGGMKAAGLEVNGNKGIQRVVVMDEAGVGFVVLSLGD